jgi:hypothetical protein
VPPAASGIQVRVNSSATVIFAMVACGLAARQYPAVNPWQSTLTYIIGMIGWLGAGPSP